MKPFGHEECRMSRFHHVLISPGHRYQPVEIARLTAPILGKVLFDETRRMKVCGGWWLRDGEEQQGQAIARVATQQRAPFLHVESATPSPRVEIIRTIRISLDDDRLKLVTPRQERQIPVSSIRALDLSLSAEDADDAQEGDLDARRARILRGLAEAMMMGTPAGDLLEKISESQLINPQPRLLLLGPDPQAWAIDRSTVFPDLASQGAVQSLANLLRFSGIVIGSLHQDRTTPETRALWRQLDLSGIRRDSLEEQQARIEALHMWIQHGGSLGEAPETR